MSSRYFWFKIGYRNLFSSLYLLKCKFWIWVSKPSSFGLTCISAINSWKHLTIILFGFPVNVCDLVVIIITVFFFFCPIILLRMKNHHFNVPYITYCDTSRVPATSPEYRCLHSLSLLIDTTFIAESNITSAFVSQVSLRLYWSVFWKPLLLSPQTNTSF